MPRLFAAHAQFIHRGQNKENALLLIARIHDEIL
jgi:hypothetical protein